MRAIRVTVLNLQFEPTELSQTLIESLDRQGQTFPLRVKDIGNGMYAVIDGKKRATYFQLYKPDALLSCDVVNDFTTAGSNYWGEKNHH